MGFKGSGASRFSVLGHCWVRLGFLCINSCLGLASSASGEAEHTPELYQTLEAEGRLSDSYSEDAWKASGINSGLLLRYSGLLFWATLLSRHPQKGPPMLQEQPCE